jgi:hypothetical protein
MVYSLTECLSRLPNQLAKAGPEDSLSLKEGLNYNWSWTGLDKNRILTISFSGILLSAAEKTGLQTALDARFGADKVIMQ